MKSVATQENIVRIFFFLELTPLVLKKITVMAAVLFLGIRNNLARLFMPKD